jgi:hypothetical protein
MSKRVCLSKVSCFQRLFDHLTLVVVLVLDLHMTCDRLLALVVDGDTQTTSQ